MNSGVWWKRKLPIILRQDSRLQGLRFRGLGLFRVRLLGRECLLLVWRVLRVKLQGSGVPQTPNYDREDQRRILEKLKSADKGLQDRVQGLGPGFKVLEPTTPKPLNGSEQGSLCFWGTWCTQGEEALQ